MWRGTVSRLALSDWHTFAAELDGTPSDVAYGLGCLREDLPDSLSLVVKDDPRNGTLGFVSRTKDNLSYRHWTPAFALFDYDTKGMPSDVATNLQAAGGFSKALELICPALAHAGYIPRSSTSAGLINGKTGKRYDSIGQHLYVPIKDGSDMERFLYTMHDRAWLEGFGWYLIGRAGQLRERSIIDHSVWSPERLIFEANPTLEPPWKQEPRKAVIRDGMVLDSHIACVDLSDGENTKVNHLKAKAKEALAEDAEKQRNIFVADRIAEMVERGIDPDKAKTIAEQWTRRILKPDVALVFDDRKLVDKTVREVLTNPYQFNGKTLADPIEGIAYGKGKAKIYVNSDGSVWIHSFAHGGADYKLVHDVVSLEAEINKAIREEIV
jgi:hypothetical protein